MLLRYTLPVCTLLFFLVAPSQTQAQDVGTIVGRVVEAGSGQAMPGANVVIEGTSRGTSTNQDGAYVLARLAPGSYTLAVSYIGYEAQTQTVAVTAGTTTTANFEIQLASIRGGEIIILGSRAQGQAKALSQQQNAPDRRFFGADLAGGYGTIRNQGSAKASATFGNRVSGGRFGYLVNDSFSRRNFGSDNLEPEYDFGDDDAPLGGDDALEELQVRYYDVLRQRLGFNSVLDYRLSEKKGNSKLYCAASPTESRPTSTRYVGVQKLKASRMSVRPSDMNATSQKAGLDRKGIRRLLRLRGRSASPAAP